MRIVFMTPGSGDNFYCENCLRDKAIVVALRSAGHDATSVPLYLPPLLQDTDAGTDAPIFFGGVNVFLQQHLSVFRRTPRWIDRLFDSRPLLKMAAKKADMTTAAELGKTTVSMLRGEKGRQAKELQRLIRYLADDARPQVVVLSNALLLGMAPRLKQQLGAGIVCMLQDEHDFIDALPDEFADQAWGLMRERSSAVDMFVAGSRYYADLMRPRLGLDAGRVRVVYNGIDPEGYTPAPSPPSPPTVGFLQRMHPSKGLDMLAEAFIRLKADPELRDVRLLIAGGKTENDEPFVRAVGNQLKRAGVSAHVEWAGDFDRQAKRDLLPRLTVMCVPDRVGPASALFMIESLLAGVPVVEPDCGVFGELVEATGAGLLFEPGNLDDLTAKLKDLLADPDRAHQLGQAGRAAAMKNLTAEATAKKLAELFETLT